MNKKSDIFTNQANASDARFLEVLDDFMHTEKRTTWSESLSGPEPQEVYTARIGGLYIGYLAVRRNDEGQIAPDIVIKPNYDVRQVAHELLIRSGFVSPHAEVCAPLQPEPILANV